MKAKRIGDLQTVTNKNPHRLASKTYKFLRVQEENGNEVNLLFTDREINRAKERAAKNPEDLPKVSTLRDLFD